MAVEREALRDWHRLFGLLLTDFFTGSPFTVEVERDLSEQQQFLDVVVLRRGRGLGAGELSREADDAPLHLFSASPGLVSFGQGAYRRHSENTSLLLRQLLEKLRGEGFTMSYTMEDFKRDYNKEHFLQLT